MNHQRFFSVLAAGAVLLIGGAVSGSALAPQTAPTAQERAQQLLDNPAVQLTAGARSILGMIARGDRQFASGLNSAENQQVQKAAARTSVARGGTNEDRTGLANVLVNNPAEDSHQTDQTTQSETSIAVSGKNVVVGYNDSQQGLLFLTAGANLQGYSYSSDGGKTFTDGGTIPDPPGEVNLSDPWLGSDRSGNIYYATLVTSISAERGGFIDVGVAKSTDGGKTFSAPVRASTQPEASDGYSADKDNLAVGRDRFNASADTIYASWDDFLFQPVPPFQTMSGLPVSHSTDGGQTWTVSYADKVVLFGGVDCSMSQFIGANLAVNPADGTVYVAAELIHQSNPGCIFPNPNPVTFSHVIYRSTDDGQTWSGQMTISNVVSASPTGLFKLGEHQYMRDLEFPSLAFSRDGKTLYDTWNDGRSGHSQVMLASSTDQGTTWNVSAATNTTNDEIQPALSVDRSGLHILAYHLNANGTLDVLVWNSRDGTTFTSQRVTSQSFPGVFTLPQFDPIIAFTYMGDYIANVSDGSSQYFAWGDNRNVVTNFMFPQGRHDPDVFFAKRAANGED